MAVNVLEGKSEEGGSIIEGLVEITSARISERIDLKQGFGRVWDPYAPWFQSDNPQLNLIGHCEEFSQK